MSLTNVRCLSERPFSISFYFCLPVLVAKATKSFSSGALRVHALTLNASGMSGKSGTWAVGGGRGSLSPSLDNVLCEFLCWLNGNNT